jgi:hypothetical protein
MRYSVNGARQSQRGRNAFLNLYLIRVFPRSNNTVLTLAACVAVSPIPSVPMMFALPNEI